MWNVFTKADIKLKFCQHNFTIEYSLLINSFLVWKNMNNNKDTTTTSNGHYSRVFSVDFEQVFTDCVEAKTARIPLLPMKIVCLKNCIWCQSEAFSNISDTAI